MLPLRHNRTLQFAAGWMIYAFILATALDSNAQPNTLQGFATSFISELALPYICGGLSAALPLARYLAVVSAATFLATLFFHRLQYRFLAKGAMRVLLVTAIYTIWLDKYMIVGEGFTLVRLLLLAIDVVLKGPTMILDVIATFAWIVAVWRISGAVDATFHLRPAPTPDKEEERFYYGTTMLGLSLLLMIFAQVPAQTYMVLMGSYGRQALGYELTTMGVALNIAHLLAYLPLPWVGVAIDKFGRRKVALVSILALAVCSLLSCASFHLVFMVLHGTLLRLAGSSLLLVAATTLPFFYDRRLGRMEGFLSVGIVVIMPAFIPNVFLNMSYSIAWPWVMVLIASLMLVFVLPLVLVFYRNSAVDVGCALDDAEGVPEAETRNALAGGYVLAAALATAAFWLMFSGYVVAEQLEIHNASQITSVRADNPAGAFKALAFFCAIGGLCGGWLCDRLAAGKVLTLALVLSAVAMVAGSAAGFALRPADAQAITGFCTGMYLCAVNVALVRQFGRRRLATIRAFLIALVGILLPLINWSLHWTGASLDSRAGLILAAIITLAIAAGMAWMSRQPERTIQPALESA
jgi:MFS family permease